MIEHNQNVTNVSVASNPAINEEKIKEVIQCQSQRKTKKAVAPWISRTDAQ